MQHVDGECAEDSGSDERQSLLNPIWGILILEPGVTPYKKIKEYLDHISSELLEAAIESENPQSTTISGKLQKPEGFASEAADIIILTLAMCLHNNVDIDYALQLKLKYLKRRERERLSHSKNT